MVTLRRPRIARYLLTGPAVVVSKKRLGLVDFPTPGHVDG